jgi:DNA-binding response OmpR family regulator
MPIHVLLVDDSPDTVHALRERLDHCQPLAVTVASSWQAARVRLVVDAFDVIVLRERVRDASADEMLTALRGLPHAPVVVATPAREVATALRLRRAGADDCVMRNGTGWTSELRGAIERLTASARRLGTTVERSGGVHDYADVLAALLLRPQAVAAAAS